MGRKEDYGIHTGFDVQFSDRLIAWIDVLGFRGLVMSNDPGKIDQIDFLMNLIPDMIKSAEANHTDRDVEFSTFSDTIVVSAPTRRGELPFGNLFRLGLAVARFQFEMAMSGIWTRGALSVGPLFHSSKAGVIAGPAFIRAYELEKTAEVPRVILDREILKYFRATEAELVEEMNCADHQFIGNCELVFDRGSKDPDDSLVLNNQPIFLDYLSILRRRADAYLKIAKRLNDAVTMSNGSARILDKHRWTIHYFCKTLEGGNLDANGKDLKTTIQEMAALKQRLDGSELLRWGRRTARKFAYGALARWL